MEISRGSESKGVRLREQEVSPCANVVVVVMVESLLEDRAQFGREFRPRRADHGGGEGW